MNTIKIDVPNITKMVVKQQSMKAVHMFSFFVEIVLFFLSIFIDRGDAVAFEFSFL